MIKMYRQTPRTPNASLLFCPFGFFFYIPFSFCATPANFSALWNSSYGAVLAAISLRIKCDRRIAGISLFLNDHGKTQGQNSADLAPIAGLVSHLDAIFNSLLYITVQISTILISSVQLSSVSLPQPRSN